MIRGKPAIIRVFFLPILSINTPLINGAQTCPTASAAAIFEIPSIVILIGDSGAPSMMMLGENQPIM